MKSEKEFLNDMWRSISIIEHEERQKGLARQRNRFIRRQSVVLYLSVILLFSASLFFNIWLSRYNLLVCLVCLLLGYILDNFFYTNKGGIFFGNRNCD